LLGSVLAAAATVLLSAAPSAAADAAPRGPSHARPSGPAAIARATGKPVLLRSLTTPTSETFVNPNGSRTLRQNVLPVRRKTKAGWVAARLPAATQAAPHLSAQQLATQFAQRPGTAAAGVSIAPGESGWTEVYAQFPTTNYWDGANDHPDQAKVGSAYPDGSVTVRSFFQFSIGSLFGKHIDSAQVNFGEIYAPSCSARTVDILETSPISSATTWNNQPYIKPQPLASPTVAYGYNNSCPANPIGADAGQAVRDSLSGGNSFVTFGLKADNESDVLAWKKFNPNATLIVNYDSPPDVPGNLSEGFPGQAGLDTCQNHQNAQYMATANPSLHATVTDADNGPLVAARFEWYVAGNFNIVGAATAPYAGSGSPFSVDIPPGTFADGTDIAWRVQGVNDSGTSGPFSQWCEMYVDTTAPGSPPAVSSTTYTEAKPGDPNAAFNGGPGQTAPFTFGANGVVDVAGFRYCEAAGQCTPANYVAADQLGGSASVPISPVAAGPNELCVQSVDRAGNLGPIYRSDASSGKPVECYHFLVGPGPGAAGIWHMDNFGTATNVPDSSGNGHDATAPVPAQSYWTGGRVNESMQFNGTSAAASTNGPVLHTDQSLTIAAWVKLARADGSAHTAVSQDGNHASAFYLQYRGDIGNGRWVFAMSQADTPTPVLDEAVANVPVQAGVWTHLVGEYDAAAGTLKIFVNGALAGTGQHTSAWDAAGSFEIGRAKWTDVPCDFWPGAIDEVQAFQRALPMTAAAAGGGVNVHDLATGNPVQQVDLPLNDGSGTVAHDQSGNYNNGTMSASVTWVPGHAYPHAAHFDEASAQIVTATPAVPIGESFTVSAEARLTSTDGNTQTLVSEDGQHTSLFALQYCGQKAAWCFSLASSDAANAPWQTVYAPAAPAPQANVWTQLTGVYDAAAQTITIYVNGQPVGTQAVTSAPPNVTGPLVVGRARQNDAAAGYLGGSVDDVQAFTGVLPDDQISQEYQDELAKQVPSAVDAYPGALTSYYQAGAGHFVTTGPAPSGYYVEGQLGLLAPVGTPNTTPIYSCSAGSGPAGGGSQFLSFDPQCEGSGNRLLATLGAVYNSPPAGLPARAIYRCVTNTGDHFMSADSHCGGASNVTVEGAMGYLMPYVYLNRYIDGSQDHAMATSTLLASPGATSVYPLAQYTYEGQLGLLSVTAGDVPVYTCVKNGDEYLATHSDCGGGGAQTIAWIGNLWSSPPAATASTELYDCQMTGSGERFDSADPSCEGQTVVGALGYIVTQP
jgi:hypothetical protein